MEFAGLSFIRFPVASADIAGLWVITCLGNAAAGDEIGVILSNETLPDLLLGLLDSRGLFFSKQPLHIQALPTSLVGICSRDSM